MFHYYLFVIRSLLEPIYYLSIWLVLHLHGLCIIQVNQLPIENAGNKWVCTEHVQTSLGSVP